MIKRILCTVTALAAAALLCGCSGKDATLNGDNSARVPSAGIDLRFPADWAVYTGDDIYEITYSRDPDGYGSAEELKKDAEDNGERYIVYAEAPGEDALALFSSQPLEGGANEDLTVGTLARAVHDNIVFEYRMNGCYTESSLSEETMGGVSGWLSDVTVFEEQGAEALCEQREFTFEKDKTVYSLRIFAQGVINERYCNITFSGF